MKKAEIEKKSLMELFEIIIDRTSESGLSATDILLVRPALRVVGARLGMNEEEALMMSAFVNLSDDHRIGMSDLSRHFGCRNIRVQTYWPQITSLIQKRYICRRTDSDGEVTLYVPYPVINALRDNTTYTAPSVAGLQTGEWFEHLSALMIARDREGMSYEFFTEELARLIELNPKLDVVQRIRYHHLDESSETMILMLALTDLFVQNNDDHVMRHDVEDLFENERVARRMARQLEAEQHTLQEKGLVEFACSDGQVESNAWKLTDKAKQEFLVGLPIHRKTNVNLTKAEKIVEKKLYFAPGVESQVEKLRNLLSDERFRSVQERLEKHGMRRGFACIFYGSPGTGKTETVLQLARETGRDIKMVDVPNLRSKWVGDTEKNIKAVFDEYRALCRDAERMPILLFNEADAVLCKRQEGATTGVDKMENAMQNIILQEMETLDGIMVATTNLTGNLDAAFERRFLYKIEFPKPTANESRHIWHTMLPELTDEEALSLAREYSFSGGQIENIARKHIVDTILEGEEGIAMEAIREACRSEEFRRKSGKKVGFE